MAETPAEIVAAIVGGEVHRFAEIVERYDGIVRRIVAGRVADPDSREEVVQETFYRAFRRLGDLENPDRLETWLVRIAERRITQLGRAVSRRNAREQEAARPSPVTSESGAWIWEETARLPRAYADALFLRYRLGLDYGEIADRLGIARSTVRGRLYKARQQLRAELERRGLRP